MSIQNKIHLSFVLNKECIQQMKDESVAFSIYTNTFYLSRQNGYKDHLSIPRSFTEVQHKVDYDAPIFEKAGFEHMINIFKDKNMIIIPGDKNCHTPNKTQF
jgi:hypothetical protein